MTVTPITLVFEDQSSLQLRHTEITGLAKPDRTVDGYKINVQGIGIECTCRPNEFSVFSGHHVFIFTPTTSIEQAVLCALALSVPGPGDGNPMEVLRAIRRLQLPTPQLPGVNSLLLPVMPANHSGAAENHAS